MFWCFSTGAWVTTVLIWLHTHVCKGYGIWLGEFSANTVIEILMNNEVLTSKQTIYFVYFYPAQRSWRGVYWFHVFRLSICGPNSVRSVSSTKLDGSITYLRILSKQFQLCGMIFFSIQIVGSFDKYFKFVTLILSCFDLVSIMHQWYG